MIPNTGTGVIAVAAFTSVLAAALLLYGYIRQTDEFRREILAATGVSTVALVAAHTYLTYQFVVGDYTNAYVWENSADYLPLLYRLTGPYASHEGSILFWATLTSFVATWTVYSSKFDGKGSRLAQSITMAIVAWFAVMLTTQSPFIPIETVFDGVSEGFVPPDGDGLNPLLVDPYMAIHPPITFAAYALLILPFALGVTHFVSLFRGEETVYDDWLTSNVAWLRVSWILLTAAIALGGIWAYRVLGWGGFWSWDPVETAVLVPWLALTAALHATNRYDKTREYPVFAPAAAGFVFPLVVYATVVVRSDVFRSVHSFSAGGIGVGIMSMMVVTVAIAVGLPFAYWFLKTEGGGRPDDEPWFSRRTVYHSAVLAFGALGFVAAWGLTFPVIRSAATGVEVSVGTDYYNLWSYPVVLVGLLLGGTYAVLDTGRRRLALAATVGVALLTFVAAFVAPSSNWILTSTEPYDPVYYRLVGGMSVLSVVPPAAYFYGAWIGRYFSRIRGIPSRSFRLRETGVLLLHIGGVVLIIAVSFVYLFSTSASVAVIGVESAGENPEPLVQEFSDEEYEVHVLSYEAVDVPTIDEAARTPAELLEVDSEADLVRGEITETGTLDGTDVARLDDSSVWLAGEGVEFEDGVEVIARGTVFENDDPDMQAFVFTDQPNMGTVDDPPEGVYTPRVVSHEMELEVYENGELVADGVVANQDYLEHDMQTNDVIIERAIRGDTYVRGTYNAGTAEVTVETYPLANQIWIATLLMLLGMVVLTVADNRFRE